jgi:hypothetical protein
VNRALASGAESVGNDGPSILRALIRAEVQRLVLESGRLPGGQQLRLDQAGPYEGVFDASGFSDGLLGSHSRLVTGVLLPSTTVALTIETLRGEVERAGVIELGKLGFPDPGQDSLAQLALPAAAWIALEHDALATLGGTRQWGSYASFAAGYAWETRNGSNRDEELDRAMAHYRRAGRDPANTAAAVNLAALEHLREQSRGYGDPARQRSHERLTDVVRSTGDNRGDPQWHRARYLLASVLRDILDAAPAAPTPADRADPKLRTSLSDQAREAAAELALELEGQGGSASEVSRQFAASGRAAALTLLARQAIPRAGSLADVPVTAVAPDDGAAEPGTGQDGDTTRQLRGEPQSRGPVAQPLTESTLPALIESLQAGAPPPGTSERIVDFVRGTLELDDEARYNLARYHDARAWICTEASLRYRADPAAPADLAVHLAELAQQEQATAQEYAASVRAGGDPVLVRQVELAEPREPQADWGESGGTAETLDLFASEDRLGPFNGEAGPDRGPGARLGPAARPRDAGPDQEADSDRQA